MLRLAPLLFVFAAGSAAAASPASQPLAGRFNADPSPHYFTTPQGGGFFLYASDDASNSGKYWDSTAWRLYTSPDMTAWRDAGAPLSVTVFKWARPDAKAWAPEAAFRNGKYYFYAPVGGDKIGVAVSSRPDGGFVDARTDALVDKTRDLNAGDEPIDPAVFVDNAGQAYMYFGTRVPKVVKLKADMVTLDGPIENVVINGLAGTGQPRTYGEAPFLHEHKGVYYFSFSSGWPGQILYATGTSPMGPFSYRGVILDYLTISTNHQAIVQHRGKSYLFYHDRLLPGGGSFRRSIAIAPLDYETDGSIRQVALAPSQVGKPPAPKPAKPDTPKPVKVLIVSGGCCHDYPQQRELLERALKERMPAEVSHLYYDPKPGEKATRPALPIYGNPQYADGYDVVIHNECAADEDSAAALDAVLAPHRKGIPAVNLHCAMHSYRSGAWKQAVKAGDANARWFEFTGIQSTGHGPQSPIRLTVAGNSHPVAAGFVPYTTGVDELYNNLTSFGVTPVLLGVQPESRIEADRDKTFTVAWTHTYGPQRARVFSTTLAHNAAVMADPRYLDLVARGVLWAVGRL